MGWSEPQVPSADEVSLMRTPQYLQDRHEATADTPLRRPADRIPSLLTLQSLAGNRAVTQLLLSPTRASAFRSPVVQRCGPDRPNCGCSDEERAAAESDVKAAGPTPPARPEKPHRDAAGHPPMAPDRWMDPEQAPHRACALAEAIPGEESAEQSEQSGGGDGASEMISDVPVEYEEQVARVPRPAAPHAGSATIVCDGSNGYRVDMGGWAGAPCGIAGCVRRHEEQHIADWQGRWPDGCKNKKNGDTIPLGGAGYAAFLKASECSAYGIESSCITPLKNAATTEPCKTRLKDHLEDTERQKKSFC